MIALVAFLRAVLPKRWYSKEEQRSIHPTSHVEKIRKASFSKNNKLKQPTQEENTWNHLIFCVVGIQVCYLAWGTAQERLMGHSYGGSLDGGEGERFQFSSVLLLINKFLSASLAIALLTRQQQSSQSSSDSNSLRNVLFQTAPPLLYSYAALGNGISSW